MELHISSKGIFLLAALQGWFPGSECQDPSVYLPESITALKGSCVEIPCSFNVEITDFLLIWYRDQTGIDPHIFNNKYPSNINAEFRGRTSLVRKKSNSCSLRIDNVRDSDTYYPCINGKINCNLLIGYKKVLVQVSDTPDQPVLKLPTNLTEGATVRISCSVRHTCTHNPPVLQWNKEGFNKTERREELEGGVWRFVQEMDFIPTYQDHDTPIICQSKYRMGKVSQESLILNISYPPKNVTITKRVGEKEMKEGQQVTLQCTSNANPPAMNYTWYHIKKERVEELQEYGEYITVTINWENMKYSCSARNEIGENDSNIMDLHLFFHAKVVEREGKQNLKEGDTLELECLFLQSNLSSIQYSWYRNGIILNNETQMTLRIRDVKESHSGNYSCEVHIRDGNFNSLSFTVTITSPTAQEELPMILGGVAAIIFIILIGLVLYIFVRSRKFQKSATSAKRNVDTVVQECINPVYGNIEPESHYCTVNEEDPRNDTEQIYSNQMEREDLYAQPNKKRNTVQYTSIKYMPGAQATKELKHEEIQYASIQH